MTETFTVETKEELDRLLENKAVVLFTMNNLPSQAMKNIFLDVCNKLSFIPYTVDCMAPEFFDSLAEYDITVAPTVLLGDNHSMRKSSGPITRKALTDLILKS